MWMSEYGAPFDLRRLPRRQFKAHIAILEGQNAEQEERQREIERQQKKV